MGSDPIMRLARLRFRFLPMPKPDKNDIEQLSRGESTRGKIGNRGVGHHPRKWRAGALVDRLISWPEGRLTRGSVEQKNTVLKGGPGTGMFAAANVRS